MDHFDAAPLRLRHLAEATAGVRGLVRVTAPWLVAETLAPVLERFLEQNPDVTLDLWITNHRVDLVEEGVDLAIRPGTLPDSSLVARRLGDVEHCLCASPDYLAGRRPVTKPSDLREHSCLVLRGRSAQWSWTFERSGEKVSVPVRGRYAASYVVLLRRGALAGLGVASVPEFLVEDDLAAGRLVRLLAGWSTGRGAVHLVYPSGRHLSASVRGLVDLLVSAFAAHPPWTPRAPSSARAAPPARRAKARRGTGRKA